MKPSGDLFICALLVGEYENDRLLLQEIFREAGWRLIEARDRKKALKQLDRNPVQVVIASREAPNCDWKTMLESLARRPHPPELIVTSRTADEQLWSEVLNCGGYDVLPQPFRREEIERVIASARRHYDRGPGREHLVQRPSVA